MELQVVCTGSLEEIAAIIEAIRKAGIGEVAPQVTDTTIESDESKGIVPPDLMSQALRRQPLTKHTRTMLKSICECEEDERYLSRSDICEATGLNPTQLNGVLGRFGQRVKGTDGYDGTSNYFEYRWLEESNEWAYRLPETLREVVREILSGNSTR